jgi:hypothetical protein
MEPIAMKEKRATSCQMIFGNVDRSRVATRASFPWYRTLWVFRFASGEGKRMG